MLSFSDFHLLPLPLEAELETALYRCWYVTWAVLYRSNILAAHKGEVIHNIDDMTSNYILRFSQMSQVPTPVPLTFDLLQKHMGGVPTVCIFIIFIHYAV